MFLLTLIGDFFNAFSGKKGAEMRARDAAVPVDHVKKAGYIATFAQSGNWPFNK